MKARFEFDLDDYNDRERFTLLSMADGFYFVLRDLDAELKEQAKYDGNKEAELIRDKLYELMDDHKVRLDILS